MFVNTKLLSVLIFLIATITVSAKSWRGIEPLHSTRADVQRLLGPPNDDHSPYTWDYNLPDERVSISFSTGICEEGIPGGYRVPKDIVTSISVYPKRDMKLKDALSLGNHFEHFHATHTPMLVYYIDEEEGIQFSSTQDTVDHLEYFRTSKDDALICEKVKYAAPIAPGAKLKRWEPVDFDTFGDIRFEDAKARLDNFVIQLFELQKEDPNWRGYIIVYAGRRAFTREAQYKANCYRNYLVRVRHIDPATVFAADGGYREQPVVQMYIGRAENYPPPLLPTVSPKKVEVIKRRLRSCSELSLKQ